MGQLQSDVTLQCLIIGWLYDIFVLQGIFRKAVLVIIVPEKITGPLLRPERQKRWLHEEDKQEVPTVVRC